MISLLSTIIGGEHFFINPVKKIGKYIPSQKKKSMAKKESSVPFTVHQRVKFYVQSLTQIR